MEASNNQKMRETLENIKQEAETTREYRDYPIAGAPDEWGACQVVDAEWLIDECKSALAAPARNCDVATEAEAIESLQQTIPLDGLSENDRNIITACIKDIVGILYAPYKEG